MRKTSLTIVGGLLGFVGFFILLAPLLVNFGASLNREALAFPPREISFASYAALLERDDFLDAAQVSLVVGAIAATAATAVALLVAMWARVEANAWSKALSGVVLAPLFIPGVLLGLSLYQLGRATLDWPAGTLLYIGHALIAMPFAVRTVVSRMSTIPLSQDQAAMMVGATPWRAQRSVMLPQLAGACLAAWLLSFVVSWSDFNVSIFLASGSTKPLPVALYSYIRYEYEPLLAALGVVLITISAVAVAALLRLGGRAIFSPGSTS